MSDQDRPLSEEKPFKKNEQLPLMSTVKGDGDSQSDSIDAPSTPLPDAAFPAIAGHEIHRELGRGGMGVVYLARHIQLERLVALKMIIAGDHASEEQILRFQNEARAVARLRHPNIIHIYEIGSHNGLPFFSLEHIAGGSLADRLAQIPLTASIAAQVVEVLAGAMHAAHEEGIVHRDLKPGNILLSKADLLDHVGSTKHGTDETVSQLSHEQGSLKITDFGLAKQLDQQEGQTKTGRVMGTPNYMAPEQARGENATIGPSADIYALGAILYECITGTPPFKAATSWETVLQVLRDDPVPPGRLQPTTPRDLETICLKCLEKKPEHRYQSARALADDLRRFRLGEPIQARPVGRTERLWKWLQRRPGTAAALAAIILLLCAGTAVSSFFAVRSAQRAEDLGYQKLELQKSEASLKKALADLQITIVENLISRTGEQSGKLLTTEVQAIEEIADLQPSSRLLLLERALRDPDLANRMSRRAPMVLRGIVGLRTDLRDQAEQLIGRALNTSNNPDILLSSATLAVDLDNPNRDLMNKAAQRVLALENRNWGPQKLLRLQVWLGSLPTGVNHPATQQAAVVFGKGLIPLLADRSISRGASIMLTQLGKWLDARSSVAIAEALLPVAGLAGYNELSNTFDPFLVEASKKWSSQQAEALGERFETEFRKPGAVGPRSSPLRKMIPFYRRYSTKAAEATARRIQKELEKARANPQLIGCYSALEALVPQLENKTCQALVRKVVITDLPVRYSQPGQSLSLGALADLARALAPRLTRETANEISILGLDMIAKVPPFFSQNLYKLLRDISQPVLDIKKSKEILAKTELLIPLITNPVSANSAFHAMKFQGMFSKLHFVLPQSE